MFYILIRDVGKDELKQFHGAEASTLQRKNLKAGEIGLKATESTIQGCVRLIMFDNSPSGAEVSVVDTALQKLSDKIANLLRATPDLEKRCALFFSPTRLEAAKELTIGKAVMYLKHKYAGVEVPGMIVSEGPANGKPGTWFGVEILGHKNDDFNTELKRKQVLMKLPSTPAICTVFEMRLHPLLQDLVDALRKRRATPQTGLVHGMVTRAMAVVGIGNADVQTASKPKPDDPITLKSRVCVLTTNGDLVAGVVRWKRNVAGYGPCVGLEMDKPVSTFEVEDPFTVDPYAFSCPAGRQLFRPTATLVPFTELHAAKKQPAIGVANADGVVCEQPDGSVVGMPANYDANDVMGMEVAAFGKTQQEIQEEQEELLAKYKLVPTQTQTLPIDEEFSERGHGENRALQAGRGEENDVLAREYTRERLAEQQRLLNEVTSKQAMEQWNDSMPPEHRLGEAEREEQQRQYEELSRKRRAESSERDVDDIIDGALRTTPRLSGPQQGMGHGQIDGAAPNERVSSVDPPQYNRQGSVGLPPYNRQGSGTRVVEAGKQSPSSPNSSVDSWEIVSGREIAAATTAANRIEAVVAEDALAAASSSGTSGGTKRVSQTSPQVRPAAMAATGAGTRCRVSVTEAPPLRVNDRVAVTVNGVQCTGNLRYLGRPTEAVKQDIAGVELDDEYEHHGSSDGTFMGVHCFECEGRRTRALFVRASACQAAVAVTSPVTRRSGDRVIQADVLYVHDELARKKVTACWAELVDKLGLVHTTMQNDGVLIGGKSDSDQLLSILYYYVNNVPEPTLDHLMLALSGCGHQDVALKLQERARRAGREVPGWSRQDASSARAKALLSSGTSSQASDGLFHSNRDRQPAASAGGGTPPTRSRVTTTPASRTTDGVEWGPSEDDRKRQLISEPVLGNIPPPLRLPREFVGWNRGIQGQHNSCYMDSSLFAMFFNSMAFDDMLARPITATVANLDPELYHVVQKLLREYIVNPLRLRGFVSDEHVGMLRYHLKKLIAGIEHAEKDPEEYLLFLWEKVLQVDPFLSIKTGPHSNTSFIYQMFVNRREGWKMPNIQQLLEESFDETKLQLARMPKVLILQLPRYGRDFKVYEHIAPSFQLSLSNLLIGGHIVCSNSKCKSSQVTTRCYDCKSRSTDKEKDVFYYLCDLCNYNTHAEKPGHRIERVDPVPQASPLVASHLETMELFAVVCIKLSHYVTFVKCGEDDQANDAPWCFFDSMADREEELNGDGYNLPHITSMPDLVAKAKKATASQSLDGLSEQMKRLFCDPYICFYQCRRLIMAASQP